jgi:hypothetical protein
MGTDAGVIYYQRGGGLMTCSRCTNFDGGKGKEAGEDEERNEGNIKYFGPWIMNLNIYLMAKC